MERWTGPGWMWALALVWPAQIVGAAEPCALPPLPLGEIRQALSALSQAPPPRPWSPPSRLRGLLPAHVSMGVRNGIYDQAGWYAGATSLSERATSRVDTGWWLRMDWDLRPLWWPGQPLHPPADQHLARAERAERLAERVSAEVRSVHKAQSLALQVSEGDLLCKEAQAEVEAALVVIESVLVAARP